MFNFISPENKIVRIPGKQANLLNDKTEEFVLIRSFSNPLAYYEINKTKKICSCPAFQKSKRICKHLRKALNLPSPGFSKSLLKSALQKSIRRNETVKAVKIANIFLAKDFADCVKRLLVISIEDVLPFSGYIELTELAKASSRKSFVATQSDRHFILSIVERLASCKYRDYEYMNILHGRIERKLPYYEQGHLPKNEDDLLQALRWRSGFGMQGDKKMFHIAIGILYEKFKSKKADLKYYDSLLPKPKIDYNKINIQEDKNDIPIEAVDHHCFFSFEKILLRKPFIRNLFVKEFGNIIYTEMQNHLNQIIWRLRSGVNLKKDITTNKPFDWLTDGEEEGVYSKENAEKYRRIFKEIETEVDNLSQWYLTKAVEF